nr:podoplanin isoform X2 [Solea senegalensis]
MNVQLLLLLALAGPFCAFTHASPTEIPAELQTLFSKTDHVEEKTEATGEGFTVITGPPPTLPGVAPVESTALALLEESTFAMNVNTEENVSGTETVTAAAPAEPLTSDAPVKETTTPPEETETEDLTVAIEVTTAPEIQPEVTEAPEGQAEVTAAAEVQPEETEAPEVQPELTVATNADKMGQDEEVVVENGTEGELSSGQVVGIVIGALLAVVIVIAVVIVVVRRMGKYS